MDEKKRFTRPKYGLILGGSFKVGPCVGPSSQYRLSALGVIKLLLLRTDELCSPYSKCDKLQLFLNNNCLHRILLYPVQLV